MEIAFVDFFSGCGGMSSGFHYVNREKCIYRNVGAFDNDRHANATYAYNFGIKPTFLDLEKEKTENIVKKVYENGLKEKQKLIVIGCAPCQGFSSHRKKDDRIDNRNTLVRKFAEIAVKLNPEIIIMENVPDLLTKKHWTHYKQFAETLKASAYKITAKIINMAEYGVPQERYRTLIIASQLGYPIFPTPLLERNRFVTVRHAIGNLTPLSPFGGSDEFDKMHVTSKHRKNTVENIKKVPLDGGSRPRGVGPKCLDKVAGFYDVYGRLRWDKPAVTITARCRTPSCGRFVHPEQHRGLSIREAALLQGFPQNFTFEGPFDDKYKQIGNAVPPIFSEVLAKHLSQLIDNPKLLFSEKQVENDPRPIYSSFSSLIAHNKKV